MSTLTKLFRKVKCEMLKSLQQFTVLWFTGIRLTIPQNTETRQLNDLLLPNLA